MEGLHSLHRMETRACPEFTHNTASIYPILEMVMLVSFPKGMRGNQDTGSTTSRFPPTSHHQDGKPIDRSLTDDTLMQKVFMLVLVTSMSFIQRDVTSTRRDQDLSMVSTRDHLHNSNLCVIHA